METVENFCVNCGDNFETLIIIESGDYQEVFCSSKCATEYYNISFRRDNRLNSILCNDITEV